MKIAILGYGKMGKAIERFALERGHEIVLKINSSNAELVQQGAFNQAEVAIEFSRPESAAENISACLKNKIPVAIGTTGWKDHYEEIAQLCKDEKGSMLVASNFSLGVNLFFALNQKLAKMMEPHTDYRVEMEEIHHLEKLDSPSGTAISLAEDIIQENAKFKSWVNHGNAAVGELPIISKREANVTGTHRIDYLSLIDKISIIHEAYNRDGFALGAVIAAEYIHNKQGIFSMQDVLNDK